MRLPDHSAGHTHPRKRITYLQGCSRRQYNSTLTSQAIAKLSESVALPSAVDSQSLPHTVMPGVENAASGRSVTLTVRSMTADRVVPLPLQSTRQREGRGAFARDCPPWPGFRLGQSEKSARCESAAKTRCAKGCEIPFDHLQRGLTRPIT